MSQNVQWLEHYGKFSKIEEPYEKKRHSTSKREANTFFQFTLSHNSSINTLANSFLRCCYCLIDKKKTGVICHTHLLPRDFLVERFAATLIYILFDRIWHMDKQFRIISPCGPSHGFIACFFPGKCWIFWKYISIMSNKMVCFRFEVVVLISQRKCGARA